MTSQISMQNSVSTENIVPMCRRQTKPQHCVASTPTLKDFGQRECDTRDKYESTQINEE
jgi:hypothetical protein